MTTRINILSALAVAATLTATALAASGAAQAGHVGGSPVKHHKNPIVNTIHPIVRHPPLHGAGSSHNPIVVSTRNCNDASTLCRRP
jgi:Spy/CpxP family protein refolding chaperone